MNASARRTLLVKLLPAPVARGLRHVRTLARRVAGLHRLRREVAAAGSLRLVIGSERIAPPLGWIETDLEYLDLLRRSDWDRVFAKNSIAAILAEHVWEHLTPADGLVAAQVCHDYLAPGGYLRIAVPDGFHPDPLYRASVKIGGSGAGAHDHKALYTYRTLSRLIEQAGFTAELLEYFDEAGTFHSVDWNPADGYVQRSRRFDERNRDGQLNYTSLIIDARKPIAN